MKRPTWLITAIVVGIAMVMVLLSIQQAFADAPYHGNWGDQPTWGNHWWFNNANETLDWYADDLWSQDHVNNIRNGHNNFPWHEYRTEQEAYNPGNNTSCDRLVIQAVAQMQLPVTAWQALNGCGDVAFLQELRLELDENAIPANVYLRHRVTYTEKGWCRARRGGGEVNYSFSHNHALGDSWLGKITYDKCFNRTGSDPNGMVN